MSNWPLIDAISSALTPSALTWLTRRAAFDQRLHRSHAALPRREVQRAHPALLADQLVEGVAAGHAGDAFVGVAGAGAGGLVPLTAALFAFCASRIEFCRNSSGATTPRGR